MDKDLENREHEQPQLTHDEALDVYIDEALEKISKGMDLLMSAEEAYTMSKACKPKERSKESRREWRERRDGFRAQGTAALFEAQELLFPDKTTSVSGTEPKPEAPKWPEGPVIQKEGDVS